MPTRKHDNKKNAPAELRDSAIVPKKEEASKRRLKIETTHALPNKRVNALATVGKKKRPK